MGLVDTFFNLRVLGQTWPLLLEGLRVTILLGVTSIVLGIAGGLLLALLRLYGPKPVRSGAAGYIDVFRAIPLLVLLVLVYYARSLGVDPFGLAWSGALLVAGGHLSVLTVIEWSVVAGCALSLVLIAARSVKQAVPEEQPVSIRGPVTYAGPGSLGGTKSALRR